MYIVRYITVITFLGVFNMIYNNSNGVQIQPVQPVQPVFVPTQPVQQVQPVYVPQPAQDAAGLSDRDRLMMLSGQVDALTSVVAAQQQHTVYAPPVMAGFQNKKKNRWFVKSALFLGVSYAVWTFALPADLKQRFLSGDSFTVANKHVKSIHPDLLAVYRKAQASTSFNIQITEKGGLRDIEEQKALVKKGASKTLNSRHMTGHAVDLEVRYSGKRSNAKDWYWCRKINVAMQKAAKDLGVKIKWGGTWKGFPDGYHYQLTWKSYPIQQQKAKKKNYISVSNENWSRYKTIVKKFESGNNYKIVNKYYYLGAYQLGAAALCDAGLIKTTPCDAMYRCATDNDQSSFCKKMLRVAKGKQPEHGRFLNNKNNWLKGSAPQFLNNSTWQDGAFSAYTLKNVNIGYKNGALSDKSSDKEILGYAAGAHLKGHAAAKKYILSQVDSADRNGTKVSSYVNKTMAFIL